MTTRAAALSGELLQSHRMNLNGIMLVSTVLNFQTIRWADGNDLSYTILGGVGRWNWSADNEYADVSDTPADAMTSNPFLKVHVSNGYYDMATPYFATRYTFHHLRLPPSLLKNVVQDDYTAGHMMYLNLPDLKKQKADLAKFIRSASGK